MASREPVTATAKRFPILCVDFDGVIHSYTSGWQGSAVISDPPVPGAFQWLIAALEHFEVCIYSSRSKDPDAVKSMRSWFLAHGLQSEVLEQLSFPTQKPAAFLTIDDRAIRFEGDFMALKPEVLRQFQPWNKQ